MPRNIVVFADGTGQDGDQIPGSNVRRLFHMVQKEGAEQIAFYDPGLGTGGRRLLGSITGMGISRNILQCYRFIFEHYVAGDAIFLFGFSRGAATVRSLSGFLHLFGVLPRSRPELIERAYGIYRTRNRERRVQQASDLVADEKNLRARIRFLGVWDTVAALGVPLRAMDVLLDHTRIFRHRFHDLSLSPSVERACQALAVDDERRTFHPVLWNTKIQAHQHMKQVWFPGMHTDVGGGYRDHALADLALEWIAREATHAGLEMDPCHGVITCPDALGHMHDSRGRGLARFYRRQRRSWDAARRGVPTVHISVVQRAAAGDYRPWILQRHPGRLVEG